MTSQTLSFTPDGRSLDVNFYHFSYSSDGLGFRKGFSQQDSLTWAFEKVFKDKFPKISKDERDIIVSNIVRDADISHKNLTLLAVAGATVYGITIKNLTLTPDLFDWYFRGYSSNLIINVTKKPLAERKIVEAKFKASLLRYIRFVQQNVSFF